MTKIGTFLVSISVRRRAGAPPRSGSRWLRRWESWKWPGDRPLHRSAPMAQGTITKMRLGRDDRNAQVFLMDKRRAFFRDGIGNKDFCLEGHDFHVWFDKAGGFRKQCGKLNFLGQHGFFFNGFLLSSPKLHFRTHLLLLESQARRKNPGFSLDGSCHGWMIWMDGLMLLAVAGLKLKLQVEALSSLRLTRLTQDPKLSVLLG